MKVKSRSVLYLLDRQLYSEERAVESFERAGLNTIDIKKRIKELKHEIKLIEKRRYREFA